MSATDAQMILFKNSDSFLRERI